MAATINRREATALINSLAAGVVPRIGLRHIAVGRQLEVNAFLQDLSTVEDGGAAFRFVCGQYGSGKSFLLALPFSRGRIIAVSVPCCPSGTAKT